MVARVIGMCITGKLAIDGSPNILPEVTTMTDADMLVAGAMEHEGGHRYGSEGGSDVGADHVSLAGFTCGFAIGTGHRRGICRAEIPLGQEIAALRPRAARSRLRAGIRAVSVRAQGLLRILLLIGCGGGLREGIQDELTIDLSGRHERPAANGPLQDRLSNPSRNVNRSLLSRPPLQWLPPSAPLSCYILLSGNNNMSVFSCLS